MTDGRLKVALLTREYPPEVYGGAGVHVTYLARELASLVDLTVHCQGKDRPDAVAHRPWDLLAGTNQALQTISADLSMTAGAEGADLVHSHTWYANLGGHLASLLYGIPHVATMHSLEPLRPWKAEQLGGGYALSSWCERVSATAAAAVIAVSDGMRADILAAYPEIDPERVRVIRNGVDTSEYAPDPSVDVVERYGIDPGRPYVVFVGRITRQKGVPVLLRAAARLDPETAVAFWSSSASCGPAPAVALRELVAAAKVSGDWSAALALTDKMTTAALPTICYGDWEQFQIHNTALEKGRMDAAGWMVAGPNRPPYHVVPDRIKEFGRIAGESWAALQREYEPLVQKMREAK